MTDFWSCLINFLNLEPVLNTSKVKDTVFNLPATADDAVLEDSRQTGRSRLRSVNGTFETTTFANPSRSLTINAGEGNDQVTLAELERNFRADVIVAGGLGDDRLDATRSSTPVVLFGDSGDDILSGGCFNDLFDGGIGIDTVEYGASRKGVIVNLRHGRALGQGHDRLVAMENIFGSDFADILIGNEIANWILGRGGKDHIWGNDGNDVIEGGAGRDHL